MPPVPPIPTNLNTPAKSSENSKTALLLDMPSTTSNSDVTGKPNQKEMAAAKVKVNAANAIVKTPSTVDRADQTNTTRLRYVGFLK
jgi:hypothetical protein